MPGEPEIALETDERLMGLLRWPEKVRLWVNGDDGLGSSKWVDGRLLVFLWGCRVFRIGGRVLERESAMRGQGGRT